MVNENSRIIVIEGTDGSGKATQTKILSDKLKSLGKKVYTTSFPNYESDSSALVKMYLNGEISPKADGVSPKAASIFYASDRYITYKKEMESFYLTGEYIMLFDRYVASNIIHQGAKVISGKPDDEETENELIQFIHWLDKLEHDDFDIPKADLTIYLKVPIEYTQEMREGRENKITGQAKQDIHEADASHLINAGRAGNIASKLLGWEVIECVKNGSMRTIEDIASEIFELVQKTI